MTRPLPKPDWLKRPIPAGSSRRVSALVREMGLNTVCEEALCPNRAQCYAQSTATFLLLGPGCTRRCTFCAVDKTKTAAPDPQEPGRVAQAARRMGLRFTVLTMTTRDDLSDHGAGHVAQTVAELRRAEPGMRVEALISDLGGSATALKTVLAARPDVLGHNIETVARLYPQVRPQADFSRSLTVLERAALAGIETKSSLMLGLGETQEEVEEALDGLGSAGCRLLTLGQYLAPSPAHHPVAEFIPPDRFEQYRLLALKMGFEAVASGPYVRSSYQAHGLWREARQGRAACAARSR